MLRGPAQTFACFARAPQPAAAQPDVGAVNHRADDIKPPEPDLELDEAARIVVDAAMEVHRIVGPGLIESVYEQALSVELGLRGVHCARQVPVAVTYKNVAIGHARIDFLVGEHLVVCASPRSNFLSASLGVLRRLGGLTFLGLRSITKQVRATQAPSRSAEVTARDCLVRGVSRERISGSSERFEPHIGTRLVLVDDRVSP